MKQIGIFAGTFNPIHAGHLTFALQAINEANLERVVFLPERLPRNKPSVEHFGHRTAMIARAIRPHSNLALLELPDIHFNVVKTMPKLRQEFKGCKLQFLFGSDVISSLKDWPDVEDFIGRHKLIVGLRAGVDQKAVADHLAQLPVEADYQLIQSKAPFVSSGTIRQALRRNSKTVGLLKSVQAYARSQWLYTDLD